MYLRKAHPEINIDILCYNTDKVALYEEYRGLKIHRIPCINILAGKFVLPNPVALVKKLYQLSQNKYDFVNTHIRFFDTCWWTWAYAKIIHAKSIFTGHCASHPNHENPFVRLIAKLVDLTFAKFSLRFYDIVTVTNKSAAKFFEDTLKRKPDEIIYGGADTNFFQPRQNLPKRSVPKTNLIFSSDDILITYVGRLIWAKGLTYLYEAAKEILKDANQNIYFIFAGPGELVNSLRKTAAQDGLDERILLPGVLNYEQVRDLFSASDIFVCPSLYIEGFPQTVLEAGASGCLVIATDTGGTKEVVEDKKTGLLIPPKDKNALKDAVTWAIENPKQAKRISQNMRKLLVEKFDWGIQSEKFYQALSVNAPSRKNL